MKNKFTNNELRKRFYKEQCEEMEGSPERFAVYENDGELVADYWLKVLEEYKAYLKGEIQGMKFGNKRGVVNSSLEAVIINLYKMSEEMGYDLALSDIIKLFDSN